MKNNEGIFLGVSLVTTNFFSKVRIKAYAKWSLKKFNRFLVVIADVPEEINWVVLKGINTNEAKLKIADRTKNLRKGYQRALIDLKEASVISVSEISENHAYNEIYHIILDEYENDMIFKKDVNSTINKNLSGLFNSIDATNSIVLSLAPYVLHELSVTIFLKWYHNPSFSSQISPKPDQLMENVLSGNSSSILKRLNIMSEPYNYFTKVLEEA